MVPKASEDLPEPDTPVNTASALRGMATSTSRRLFSRAPRTRTQWSAACGLAPFVLMACSCPPERASTRRRADGSAHRRRAPAAQSGGKCVDRPAVGDALELVFSAVGEGEFAADDEVLDRARDEDLVGPGEAHDPCRKRDREAGDVVAAAFDFPGVE